MRKRLILIGLTTAMALPAFDALAFELVSDGEYKTDTAARPSGVEIPDFAVSRSLAPLFPKIEIIAPSSVADVQPPVRIDVKFVGEEGKPVNPDSFRVYYGFMGIDITDRIRKVTQITAAGFTAEGAELPAGSHTLKLEIADTSGRKTNLTLKFKVLDK
jgi:hypothetical protein